MGPPGDLAARQLVSVRSLDRDKIQSKCLMKSGRCPLIRRRVESCLWWRRRGYIYTIKPCIFDELLLYLITYAILHTT